MTNTNRIPSLDGLRAISIAMVVVGHALGTRGLRSLPPEVHHVMDLGNLGVRVFFVISGYLITSLLIAEHDRYGNLSLVRFYYRRTLRIFPAFYAFVLTMIVADAVGWIELMPRDTLHALTYTMNYHIERSWYVGHTWSLAVEEQFYLIWPAMLVICGVRRGVWVAVAYILLAPAVRVAMHVLAPDHRALIGESFETVFDAIATGCLLAFARGWLHERTLYRSLLRSRALLLLPVAVFVWNYYSGYISAWYTVGVTFVNLSIAVCVDWAIDNPHTPFGRVLNLRPMVWIGAMSYSLYLWQQVFLDRRSDLFIHSFPVNIALLLGCAMLSFYLIEEPCLRLRQSLQRRLFAKREPLTRSS